MKVTITKIILSVAAAATFTFGTNVNAENTETVQKANPEVLRYFDPGGTGG